MGLPNESIVIKEDNADENGEYAKTILNVGDVLIVSDSGVYCCRKDVFNKTYKF